MCVCVCVYVSVWVCVCEREELFVGRDVRLCVLLVIYTCVSLIKKVFTKMANYAVYCVRNINNWC